MIVNTQELYDNIFKDYPDVLNVKQVSELLGVSTKTVYGLLKTEALASLKVGREFRVPKINVMKYLNILEPQLSNQSTA